MRIREAQKHMDPTDPDLQHCKKPFVTQGADFYLQPNFFLFKPVGKSSLASATYTLTLHEGFQRILIKNFAKILFLRFTKWLILFAAGFFFVQAGRKI